MTDRSRRPAAVFLIPAASILALAVWAVLNPDRAAAVAQRSGGLVVMLIAALLTFSFLLYGFLRVRRRASVWTVSLLSSAAVHVVTVIFFFLLTEEVEWVRVPPAPESRYLLSAAPPTSKETVVGREVLKQQVKMPEPTLRPMEETKAPRKEEAEPPAPRAHADLAEIKEETPARLLPSEPDAAPKARDILEALSRTDQPRVDQLPANVVKIREAEGPKTEPAPQELRDTRILDLAPAQRASPALNEPERKLQPAESRTALREPVRPEPEEVKPVDPAKTGIEDTLQSKPTSTPVDRLALPAKQTPRQAEASAPNASPRPQQVELARQQPALDEKPLNAVSAPEKPLDSAAPPEASLVKAEMSARPAGPPATAERLLASGPRQAAHDKPVQLQDNMAPIARPGDAPSAPTFAPVRPKLLSQDRARTTAATDKDLGGKPRVEMGSAEASPSGTLFGKPQEVLGRRGGPAPPVMDEKMASASAGALLPVTQAVGGKVATLAGASGDGTQREASAGPAVIAATRVQTGLAGADVPADSLRPSMAGRRGAASVPGAGNVTLKGAGLAAGQQETLVQADSELRAPLQRTSGEFTEGLLRPAGRGGDSQPIATVGSVSGVARTAAAGEGAREFAAGTPGGRGALDAGRAGGAEGLGAAEVARPSRNLPAGAMPEERSLAGRSVPSGSAGASAGIADSIARGSASSATLAAGDVGLISMGVAARTDTSGAPGGSGTGMAPNRPADVSLAKAGGPSGAPERASRVSAPLASGGGGGAAPAERLVSDLGQSVSGARGPEMAGSMPPAAQAGGRSIDSVPLIFAVPKAGPAGGKAQAPVPASGLGPPGGGGLMAAAKAAGGGAESAAVADRHRRAAPAAGGGVDRAPARLAVAFDLDSAASGHVRTEGPAEATRQPSSARSALLSVGTSPRPESVPEKAIYQMRKPEKRKEFIVELGGTPESEQAVELGLAWLARAQSEDGRWNLRGFKTLRECGGAGDLATEDPAMTGLVLLSFLGAGYTHTEGLYKDNVRKALEWIMSGQTEAGDLRGGGTLYGQAIATAALCESYSLTGDERLIGCARRAVDFILRAQNPEAAWRYQPRDDNDTSVTGWQILALKSAQIAGMKIPQEHFRWTEMWLDKVRKGQDGGLYCYKPGHAVTPVMTAEGWFCQLFMSEQSRARGQEESIRYLVDNLPVWVPDGRAVHLYYWYYGTLAMYLSGCDEFERWNESLRSALLKGQVRSGPAAGSWDPVDQLGPRGGRIYTTAAATLCLEVYYRFLPIYKMPKLSQGK